MGLNTPSQGSAIPCTCEGHSHNYSQEHKGTTCAYVVTPMTETSRAIWCECKWSLGAMMIATDDPLRDTPAKAEAYSRAIQELQRRLSARGKSVSERDAAAAVRLRNVADLAKGQRA